MAGVVKACGLALVAMLSFGPPALGQEDRTAERQLVQLADGAQATYFGETYRARGDTVAVLSPSSELITLAVITGAVTHGTTTARAGQALVSVIEGGKVRRFGFDAARLSASLPSAWQGAAQAPLQALAVAQKRKAFWGLVEPAGVNAAAPVPPHVEAMRQTYLGNPTILALRREAGGSGEKLARLTVARFTQAVAAGDASVVADLIDPKPFTDTGASAAGWQAARADFAASLANDATLRSGLAEGPAPDPSDPAAFRAGGYRITLVKRDRALFVAALEPVS